MERIGIYGGTFNPIHLGHIRGARHAAQTLGLDKVFMIPDRDPPHKTLPAGSASPEQRLEMVRLAVGEDPVIEASSLSLDREGPSYAWQTVAQVRQMYPDAKLYWIMGSDMLPGFPQWKCPEKILAEATLGVLYRGGRKEAEDIRRGAAQLPGQVELVENPVTTISSTDLRRLLVLGCAGEFLPEPVLAYIREKGLYDTGADYTNLSMEELERVVVSLLKPDRVRHVLGCRQAAVALARRWGANEQDASRAALLHDITKALDGPLQLTLCREYGMMLDNFSTQNPKTLHALTGSLVAKRIFGENDAVVSAIASHTTGKAGMNLLETIIYVADYMEPNRDFPGVERLRELADTDINKALKLGLTMTLEVLRQQKKDISPESREALRWLDSL